LHHKTTAMRKLLLLLAWLSLSVVSYTQTLVAYYPFNGNANDQSGNAINPTYIGSGVTLTTDRFGNANKAYNFDGLTNSYMRMPSDLLPTANRTVSLWFKALDLTSRPAFLGYGGNSPTPPGTSYFMGLNGGGCGCYYTGGHWPGVNTTSYNYSTPPVNNWTHFVVTISGGTIKIYVNGNLGISTPGAFTSNTIVASKDFSLGVGVSALGVAPYTDVNMGYFNGSLDEVRIYDNAMTDAQVLQLYKNESAGLVAYYPFNGNANDESGNGRHGAVMNGAVLSTDRFNSSNSAYYFDGVDDYIDISATGLPTTNRTVSFWLNPATGNQPSYPLSYGGSACGQSFLMAFNPGGCGCFLTQGHCGSNALAYNWATNPENKWVHYTVTINGADIKLYINGQFMAGNNGFSNATIVAGKKLIIGGLITPDGLSTYVDGSGGYFKGRLDDIRIYDAALADAQVLQLYTNESSGLVAYYPFNGNANDESGNGNNGTVNGATLTTDRFGNANKAYSFTNPGHIEVPNSNIFGDEFTVSYWFKINYYPGQRGVMSNVAVPNGGFQQAFDGTTFSYILGYSFIGGYSPNYFYANYTMQEPVSQWHHLAMTYKKLGTYSSETRLYINGDLKKTDVHVMPITYTPNAPFYIGQNHSGLNFQGDLDDIRIYNRNLSPNEIAQLADVPMMPDLIAYLPMNGDANDKSGNNRNGTVTNAVASTDKYGNNSSAFQFLGNGSGSNITLANSTGLDFYENYGGRPFSISAWVKLGPNTGDVKQIVGKHICGIPNGYSLIAYNGQLGFWMSVSSTWFPVTTTETYNDDKWHHIVAVYDVSSQKIYVDGKLKGSMLTAYNNPAYGAPVKIGEPWPPGGCGGAGVFNGEVDEVKIYGSALGAAHVTALYKQSRGSGNALRLLGDGYFDMGNLGDPHFFTIEAWIKRINISATQYIVSGNSANSWSFGVTASRLFVSLNGASTVTSQDVPEINDGKWHHVAVAFQDGPMNFYVDGVHKGWVEIGTSGLTVSNYSIGTQFSPGNSFDGEIDEVRIWDWVLDAVNADTIRSWMNRKITPAHPVYSNLVRYYNFNESNLNKTYDMAAASTGLLINNISSVTSGAAIGDVSVANFSNPMTHNTNLTLSNGEQFSFSEPVNHVTGAILYAVKDPPEVQTGILGLGGNDHYFGVFLSEAASPRMYKAVYNYTGNPLISTGTENTLQLFIRQDNSVKTWTNSGAALNTTANTLTVTGVNTEYILGSSGYGLPVTMLSFEARKISTTTAQLNWKTATELNNKGFEVQRSFDGNYFVNIGFINGAGNSDVLKEYSTTDIPGKTGRVYYRLKQVDFDEHSKLSQIVSVVFDKQGVIKVYPNPALDQVSIEGVDFYNRIRLINADGRVVREQINNGQYLVSMSLDGCKSGMYILQLCNSKESQTLKLIIGN
jgi:Concanavalin A-like lectin/glucanases superfamily/Secretion system C-terminal sorting domain